MDLQQATQRLKEIRPDLVIAGLWFRRVVGLELIRRLREVNDHVPILVIATYDEHVFANRALRAGANGYVMSDASAETIITATQRLLEGQIYVSDAVTNKLLWALSHNKAQEPDTLGKLTNRQMEVFELIGRGYSTKAIAKVLNRSVKTIEAHRENIKLKLNVSSSRELVRFASQQFVSV